MSVDANLTAASDEGELKLPKDLLAPQNSQTRRLHGFSTS